MIQQSLFTILNLSPIRQSLYVGVFLSLSACSSMQEAPVGIGSGTDDLKQSPCAVCDKEPFFVNGRWVN